MKKILLLTIIGLAGLFQATKAQTLYFPPLSTTATWDTISPASLGWCTNEIDALYDYLQQQDTKGFIVLKDGKIVLEKFKFLPKISVFGKIRSESEFSATV